MTTRTFVHIATLFFPMPRGADFPTPRPLTLCELDALVMHGDPARTIYRLSPPTQKPGSAEDEIADPNEAPTRVRQQERP